MRGASADRHVGLVTEHDREDAVSVADLEAETDLGRGASAKACMSGGTNDSAAVVTAAMRNR